MTDRSVSIDGRGCPEDLLTALAGVAELVPWCVLCGGRATVLGLFFPETAENTARLTARTVPGLYPVEAGKERFALYGLCPGCFDRPDRLTALDELFLGAEE